MQISGNVALVTGAASGLGRASAEAVVARGGRVVVVDLPTSAGADVAAALGSNAVFAPADITDTDQLLEAFAAADELGSLRAVVHCAGRGQRVRLVDKEGAPGSLEVFRSIIELNLVGSFNVLRLAAAQMARNEPLDGERGVVVLTASIAAFEGQIGQIPYASSKAGIVGMTLVAARDLASKGIRVASIAPGVMDTPILKGIPEDVRDSLAAGVPGPKRLGRPEEFADLAMTIVSNGYINGETIRLDGALRMGPVG